MSYDYFYGQSDELFSYFRIPKALFQDRRFRQLSTDARTLYGILLDRMSLSIKNGWLDEQGRVYIIYTVREVQKSLCCAEHKAVKLFRELEGIDLIERKRRGLGRPSLIYVKDFSSGLPKAQFWCSQNRKQIRLIRIRQSGTILTLSIPGASGSSLRIIFIRRWRWTSCSGSARTRRTPSTRSWTYLWTPVLPNARCCGSPEMTSLPRWYAVG